MKKQLLFLWVFMLATVYAQAQLTGTKNVPGDYPDIQSAITALNTQGVGSGGVTIILGANQTLTAPLQIGSATLSVGGAASTASNPVVINGANFAINATFTGTRAGSNTSGSNDAMIVLNGPDYITIKNCVFNEQSAGTTATTAIENAVGCYNRLSATPFDGCQFIYIENNTFNMNEASTGGAVIQVSPSVFTSTTLLTHAAFGTDPTQMNRYIYVTNNNFASGYTYVAFNGSSGANGRGLIVTGNTMTDIGGAATTSYGAYALRLDSLIFNNNVCTGALSQTTTNYIAFASTNCGGRQEANGNEFTLRNSVTTSQTTGIWYTSVGINRQMNNNIIHLGSFPNITSGTLYGLYGTYSGGNAPIDLECSGNTINNETLPPTTGINYLIYQGGSVSATNDRNIIVDNNTITNLVKNQSGTLYPIYLLTTDTVKARNNTIANIAVTNNNAATLSSLNGIYMTSSSKGAIITGNTIQNLTVGGTSTSTTSTIRGIFTSVTATGGFAYIGGNTIQNLQFVSGATISGIVVGINSSTGQQFEIYNNKIYNLAAHQSGGSVDGILVSSGTVNNVYNNMISDLRNPNANSNSAIIGVEVLGSGTTNIIHNTVYAGSTAPLSSIGVLFGGAGIQASNTAVLNIKNNIININGTAAGDAYFAAVRRASVGSSGVNPAGFDMGTNIYFAPYIYGEGLTLSSATNVYYVSGGSSGTADPAFNTSCGIFKSWKGDAGSFTEDNLTGSAGEYVPSGGSYAEGGANPVTTPLIVNDFYNIARASLPDIGAAEFAGSATDAAGPAISFTNIPNQNCALQPVLSAAISDISGVNSNPGTAPRLYYKLSTEANVLLGNTAGDNGWKYVETTDPNSPFSFTIDYTLLTATPVAGNVIQYFVVAEDMFGSPNVGTNSVIFNAGYCPTTVNLTSGAFPASGFKTYAINLPPNITISATPPTVCAGNTTSLSALFAGPGTSTIGTGTSSSTTTTPYYGSATLARRVQYLFTAAQLQAQGLVAGNMTAITFTVTTAGSQTMSDLQIKMGHTNASALVTSWNPDATSTVVPASAFTAVTGANTHTFTTPFNWDGVSNVVIEMCHSTTGATPIMSVLFQAGPTASACYTTNALGCAATTGILTTTRPIITFAGQKNIPGLTYSWDDGSAVIGTNIPQIASPNFSSSSSIDYTITATDASGCTFTSSVLVSENTTSPVIGTTTLSPSTACAIDSISLGVPVTGGCPPYTYVYTLTPSGYGTPYTLTVVNGKFSPLYAGTVNVVVTDNANQTATATVGSFTMQDPPTATGDTRCGPGIVNLTATTSSSLVNWYTNAVGGSTLFSGTNYSPTVSSTTTFYAASSSGGANGVLGLPNRVGSTTNSGYSDIGLMFDAFNSFTINSVAIYPVATTPSGNVTATIALRDNAGTILQSTTVSVPTSTNPGIKTVVPLNFVVPAAGSNYRLVFTSASGGGISGFIRESSTGYTYPYTLAGVGSITSAYTSGPSSSYYYYFYDWQVSTACESSRVPVLATVTTPPTLSTVANSTICNNEIKMLNVTSNLADFDVYTWAPQAGLFEDAAATIPYTGGNFNTVYLKSSVGSTTTYTVSGLNTTTGCLNSATTTQTIMPNVTITASPTDICVSGSSNLALSQLSGYGAGTIQWQSSPTGLPGSYTDIGSAVNSQYATPVINTTTWYGVQFKNEAGSVCTLNPTVEISVNNPQLLSTTPGSRCGTGSVMLGASASGGNSINWYANATGGIPLFTGTTYNTPTISNTTTYYAAASDGGSQVSTALPVAYPTATSGSGTTNFGLVFDALSSFTLQSVKVYAVSASSAAGTVTVDVIDGANTVLHTATFPVTGAPVGSITPTTLNLNFNIAPGTNLKIRPGFTGITGLLFEPAASAPGGNYGYPYVVPGVLSINHSTLTAAPTNTQRLDLYYYFYDWQVVTGCESARQPVVATVTPSPALTTVASATVCNNEPKMLSVTSNLPDYNVYTWAPQTNLFEDAACTILYTGGNFSTVYFKSSTGGTTTYTLTSLNTVDGCGNIATTTMTNMPAATINAAPASICFSGSSSLSLSPASGYGTGTFQWQESATGLGGSYSNISGANSNAYSTSTLTSDSWYGMVFTDGNGNTCLYNPTTQVTVVTPAVTAFNGATICGGSGTATIDATPSSGASINWFANASGGSPIGTGNTFTTPTLTATTTYYAEPNVGGAGGSASPLLVTEMDPGGTDQLEIQNVSPLPLDVTGWKVYLGNSYTVLNNVNTIVQTLSGIMNPGDTKIWTDATGANYWGNNILWNPGAFPSFSGWAAIVDNNNVLKDVVVMNWPAANLAANQVTLGGINYDFSTIWSGDGVNITTVAATSSVSRIGTSDNNAATDFAIQTSSIGSTNSGMSLPFTGFGCPGTRQAVTVIVDPNPCQVDLTTKFMIQGYYDVNTGFMQPVYLNSGVGVNASESDLVTVSLHNANPPYAQAYTFSGIQNINGNILCTFPYTALGNSYYIVLTNRNAVQTWSANPITMTATNTYDFTTSAAQAFGTNQIDVSGSGLYAIYNGDVNQDLVVDGLDFNDWETDNNNFAGGYITSDFNGDGVVDGLDFLIWEPNNNNFIGAITP